MTTVIRGISSMATRQLLAELADAHAACSGVPVDFLSIGGVDAARRVAAGEAFDVVVLAADAIDKLIAGSSVVAGSRVDLVSSATAVAVRRGAPMPDLSSAAAVRAAVLAAPMLGYSTGPSGVALGRLFDAWGIAAELAPRLVQAPAGVPVGALVARGEIALGFQQLSELIHVDGIDIVGALPADIAITTVFSAGVCATAADPGAARDLLAFLASPVAADAKRRQGMDPV